MSEHWVINASPVILLAKVGLIGFVPSIVSSLVIPQPVVEEITSIRNDAASEWVHGNGRSFIQPAVAELEYLASTEIGEGERSVISWALAHSGFVAVLDDREARNIAQRLGVKVIGTVGVVLRLKKAGSISEVKPHLLKIREMGGYIGEGLFRESLLRAGEQP